MCQSAVVGMGKSRSPESPRASAVPGKARDARQPFYKQRAAIWFGSDVPVTRESHADSGAGEGEKNAVAEALKTRGFATRSGKCQSQVVPLFSRWERCSRAVSRPE